MPFYAVHIPTKGGPTNSTNPSNGLGGGTTTNAANADNNSELSASLVFREKCEALDILKTSKDARLREFASEDDALKYAQTGYEVMQTKYADVRTSTAAVEKAAFRMPTKQELIEFRKLIEAGNYKRVKSIIWENPRYLISSGDTPTTLKEGYRYNALHVCSISKQPRIAELILQTVSDAKFVDLVLGKRADEKTCKEMAANLLDYYLNIPEKGRSETPLHLASKFGVLEMVQVLTSYPECKMTPNNEGSLPKDIICSRALQAAPELTNKIQALLEERFYVPVLRSADSAIPPRIGEPFSSNNPPHLNTNPMVPEIKIEALAGPMNKEEAKKFHRRWKTPPRIGSNVASPITNSPFISPRKPRANISLTPTSLHSPQRDGGPNSYFGHTPTMQVQRRALFNSTPIKPQTALEYGDTNATNGVKTEERQEEEMAATVDKQNGNHQEKPYADEEILENANGAENQQEEDIKSNNNNNNNNNNPEDVIGQGKPTTSSSGGGVPPQMSMLKSVLCPKTPIMKIKKDVFFTYREQYADSPVVLSASYGGGDKDDSFCNAMNVSKCNDVTACDTPGFKERHIKISDTEKGLELIGRELAKVQNVGWREYWDFMDVFVDIASDEGLQKLENYFAQCIKDNETTKKTVQAMAHSEEILDNVCYALERLEFGKDARNGFNAERSSGDPTNGSGGDGAHTQHTSSQTTTPYTCVEKSLQVFAKRMTKSIIHNIESVLSINDTLLSELKRLKSLICSFKEDTRFLNVNFAKVHSRIGNLISIYLENSEEVTPVIKLKVQGVIQKLLLTPGDRRDHIGCVCARIMHMMESPVEQILPENLKTEDMCSKIWLQENVCNCQWETNLSRKTSRRNRMEARHKSAERKANEKLSTPNLNEYRNVTTSANDSSDDMDEELFWTDNGGSDSDNSGDDVWYTPVQSPTEFRFIEQIPENQYKLFVYGTEPTKRDLDVLNAIFHIDIDKEKHPNIHSWKSTLLGYRTEDMDYFPSPSVVRKSHSFTIQHNSSSNKENSMQQQPKPQKFLQQSPFLKQHAASSPSIDLLHLNAAVEAQQTQKLPITGKRLFMSPKLSKFVAVKDIKKPNTPAPVSTLATETVPTVPEMSTLQPPPPPQPAQPAFSTPLNKLRGLFSAYRVRLDNSPKPTLDSPVASGYDSNDSSSNELSPLHVAAAATSE